jgi:hypothetical protein
MPQLKEHLTGPELAAFGKLVYDDHWQTPLAEALDVTAATIQGWEKDGTPDGVTGRLSLFFGARRANIAAALEDLLGEPLEPSERADAILQEYEGLNPDPEMVYCDETHNEATIRVIADLLHYAAHQDSSVSIETITRAALDLYNAEIKK